MSIVDLSGTIGPGTYNLSSNPYILTQPDFLNSEYWNCALLSTNQSGSSLYFLVYDFEFGNFTVLALKDMQPQISQLINRIWGLQTKKQFSRWMDIISSFNLGSSNIYFPGDVVSVFVSDHQNIYV